MDKKLKDAIPYVAVGLVAGAAMFAFYKTYSLVKKMDDIGLDFGNDDALSSMFNTTNKTRAY